ncbi:MAG: cysteine--tRNA ligase [Elusimicrobiaceae bacterium]|nr:cysteine--tRNA ligase [Elusimicrobiaceae bacterium]
MRIYNTLARAKQEFKPLNKGAVSLYTCGPTVYNYAHIGNMRTYIFEDLLKRALVLEGFKVSHVMNITDVGHLQSDADSGEDKMERGAAREGKTAWEIAEFYTKAFFDDFHALNCVDPTRICRATEHIEAMIRLVKTLDEKGFAYRISDGLYFDTSKFPAYGALAGKAHIEGLRSGARVEFNGEKRNPSDFALWKFSPAGKKRQMEWPSPWGTGFPGWHIECSAMAMQYLGETLDMHCGGVDHIAVHHTNEIAQSEAATGKPYVRYWVHGEFLVTKDSEKMAKSSGEFLTVPVLAKKGYSPLDYRYLCLGAHYKTQLVFSWDALDFARKSLSNLRALIHAAQEKSRAAGVAGAGNQGWPADHAVRFGAAVADDLNLPKAVAVMWEAAKDKTLPPDQLLAFAAHADSVLGLDLLAPEHKPADGGQAPPEIMELIEARNAARREKNFARADELRKALLEKGVTLRDRPDGTTGWNIV